MYIGRVYCPNQIRKRYRAGFLVKETVQFLDILSKRRGCRTPAFQINRIITSLDSFQYFGEVFKYVGHDRRWRGFEMG